MVLNVLQPASKTDFAQFVFARLEAFTSPTKTAQCFRTSAVECLCRKSLIVVLAESGANIENRPTSSMRDESISEVLFFLI
jgi:hypothetical protein